MANMSGRQQNECVTSSTHEDLVNITTFGQYRKVMGKVMRVIREAYNVEKKRRQTARKKRGDEAMKRTQRVKALIAIIKQGKMNKDEIERNIEKMFGKGCKEEIEKVTTIEKIVERVEEMSKRETQLEEWETMRKESKRRQRERTEDSTSSGGGTRPSRRNLEEMKRLLVLKKHLSSGGGSTTRRSRKDGKRTGTSEEPCTK